MWRETRLAANNDRAKFDVYTAIYYNILMNGTLIRLESKFLKDKGGILTEQQRAKLLFYEDRMKSNIANEMKGAKDFDRCKRESKRFFDRNRRK